MKLQPFVMPTPKTPLLFHYTSQETLYHIGKTRKMRASHIYYMNDSNEILFALRKFNQYCQQQANTIENQSLKFFIEQLPSNLIGLERDCHSIFSISFSEAGNLLSQWRAYTPHGTGVSLGFWMNDLVHFAEQNGFKLVQCAYLPEHQDQIISETFDEICKIFLSESNYGQLGAKGQEYLYYTQKFYEYLLLQFIRIKDPSFAEEREWRLVSKYYREYTHPDIDYRISKSTLVPYIEIDLTNFRGDGYLCENIYIGSSPNFKLAWHALSAFSSKFKISNQMTNSSIPFRVL